MKSIDVGEENYKIITELRHEWGLKHNNQVIETLLKGVLPDIKTSEEPETKFVDQAPEDSQEIDGKTLRAEMKARLELLKREY